MKKLLCLPFLVLPALCFGQKPEAKTRLIKGFIFENVYLSDTLVPATILSIEIKGSDRTAMIDENGKFEIEAKEGELLLLNERIEILITDKNCYKINLDSVITDDYVFTRKQLRQSRRYFRKVKRRIAKNIKSGFYDCVD